ncbi:hypothetical protein JVT61DRAFT_12631 [Boletus reticuloceps]|uniref:Uncharacterized protein n=1 Tax=Boletus reticuloceps TaxID=495285 RepID=A0A8I3A4P2_9AGAM|nr:hypothetical protein JVT61DRAFT_12631 [Boletus reticuloceps]
MLRHCREKHGQGLLANSSFRTSMVQSIFSSLGKTPPPVLSCSSLSALPALADDPVILQDSDRDRPPLLKITLWDEFEPDIRANISQREAARVIKEKHTAKEHGGIFLSLEKAVKLYHVTTRLKSASQQLLPLFHHLQGLAQWSRIRT